MLYLFTNSFKMAFRSLCRNRLRSLLTMLGIIMGVGAVITMVSIGRCAEKEVQERISRLGRNVLFVWSSSKKERGVKKVSTLKKLKTEDAEAIKKECPSVKYMSPLVYSTNQIVSGGQNWEAEIVGVSEDYLNIREWLLESGQFFTASQVKSSAKVCVLGQTISRELFGGRSPVGRIVRIKKVPFVVIGLLSAKGQSNTGDQDAIVFAPYTTTMKKLLGRTSFHSIIVSAVSPEESRSAKRQITETLNHNHNIRQGRPSDFVVLDMVEIIAIEQKNKRTFTLLLAGTAVISLIIGGIGIMNIMLVSVMERTREIGIRLAIGAKRIDIMAQFLIESVILSITGGIAGVLLGIGVTQLVTLLPDWQKATLSLTTVFVAFIFSVMVGIFFGFYPAKKAASLDPIEALRYE